MMKKRMKQSIFVFSFFLLFHFDISALCAQACDNNEHQLKQEIVRPATPEQEGEEVFTCELCGYSYRTGIKYAGHLWGEWTVIIEPTCVEPGIEYRICTKYPDSPHQEDREIPPLDYHTYDCTVTAPTCTTPEIKTYTCRYCEHTYTEEFPALGHLYGDWIAIKTATSSNDGLEHKLCAHDSSHVIERRIPKLAAIIQPEPETASTENIAVLDQPDERASGNALDLLLASACIGTTLLFAWFIHIDYLVINWDKKKKKELQLRKGGVSR